MSTDILTKEDMEFIGSIQAEESESRPRMLPTSAYMADTKKLIEIIDRLAGVIEEAGETLDPLPDADALREAIRRATIAEEALRILANSSDWMDLPEDYEDWTPKVYALAAAAIEEGASDAQG